MTSVVLPDDTWHDLRDCLASVSSPDADNLLRVRQVIAEILLEFGVIPARHAPPAPPLAIDKALAAMVKQAEADQIGRDLVAHHFERLTGSGRGARVIRLGGSKGKDEEA